MQERQNHIFLSLLLFCSTPFVCMGSCVLQPSFVLAQTQPASARKAEAERLRELAGQQFWKKEYQMSLLNLQKALTIYREIGDRTGE